MKQWNVIYECDLRVKLELVLLHYGIYLFIYLLEMLFYTFLPKLIGETRPCGAGDGNTASPLWQMGQGIEI